jgi:radical SAM enzyme (TIGR01210 family)
VKPPLDARRVRALRPRHEPPDPWQPIAVVEEAERQPEGVADTATIFLAGAECRFTCVFCDLWRYTTHAPTPTGAIPAQIAAGVAGLRSTPTVVKLYNASNFFDERAVPASDDDAIRGSLAGFDRVVVECHPRLVAERALAFAKRLEGTLEVALGLETVDPRAALRLGKQAKPADFEAAATTLHEAGADVRVFLLVGVPFVPAPDQTASVVASAHFAAKMGARHVSLIPTRGGNGAMELLARQGHFEPASLRLLEDCLDRCLEEVPGPVFTVDLWDLDAMTACRCTARRRRRLENINLSGRAEPHVECDLCDGR